MTPAFSELNSRSAIRVPLWNSSRCSILETLGCETRTSEDTLVPDRLHHAEQQNTGLFAGPSFCHHLPLHHYLPLTISMDAVIFCSPPTPHSAPLTSSLHYPCTLLKVPLLSPDNHSLHPYNFFIIPTIFSTSTTHRPLAELPCDSRILHPG